MPPKLAALLTVGFIVYLFRRDIREKPNVTVSVWLVVLWVFLVVKSLSKWLHIFGLPGFTATSAEEGSPLDAFTFLTLIALGIYVLNRRGLSLSNIIQNNAWLTVFVLYCFLAIFWADLPFVSFKRWIKILGHPVMALLLFTEPYPREALARLMKRCAYVIFPISILWMKYYPALGRDTSEWGGVENCGIMNSKNGLGGVSALIGLFFLWHLLQVLRSEKGGKKSRSGRRELFLVTGLLLMIGYCLYYAHSATSWMALLLGASTLVVLGSRFVDKRVIGWWVFAAFLVFVIAQPVFDIYGKVAGVTGHESTIEGRGRLWATVLETDTNPVFGAGFESFWFGERQEKIWSMPEFWWHPTQAHNGYIETYLNLGIIGLFILIGLIMSTFWKIRLQLLSDLEWGRFRMSFLVAILAHNWTEAGFKGLSLSFLVFYIIAIDWPDIMIGSRETLSLETISPEEEEAILVYRPERGR